MERLPPIPSTHIFAQNHVPYVTVWAKPSPPLFKNFDNGRCQRIVSESDWRNMALSPNPVAF